MTSDQRQLSVEYLTKFHIVELLDHLTQLVAYHRPDNLRQFLRTEIATLQSNKGKSSSLFTDDDVATMFEMIDVAKQQTISVEQLKNTCNNLSSGGATENEALIQGCAGQNGRVGVDGFKQVVSQQLATKNYW